MKGLACLVVVCWGALVALPVHAQSFEIKCSMGTGGPCSIPELSEQRKIRQILLLSAGYSDADREEFDRDCAMVVQKMAAAGENVYSTKYKDRIAYLQVFLGGASLNSPQEKLKARIAPHPIRGQALTLDQERVFQEISDLEPGRPWLQPWGVGVIFNTPATQVTANASPPVFLARPYGIARFTKGDVAGSSYVVSHELAHAALNFLDEYVETGMEKVSIRLLDLLTASAFVTTEASSNRVAFGTLVQAYDVRLSEIFGANGTENTEVVPVPSRVFTQGYVPDAYEREGGNFFGKKTYHVPGKNLMGGGGAAKDDGFGWGHTAPQWRVIHEAFDTTQALRPNDRIRTVGPKLGRLPILGDKAQLVLFDGDKNHRYQPTKAYEVEIGWKDRSWTICTDQVVPLPCRKETWVTRSQRISTDYRVLRIDQSLLVKGADALSLAACMQGWGPFFHHLGVPDFCAAGPGEILEEYLPSVEVPLPYQEVQVDLPQMATRYSWRFRTDNGTWKSGWTDWAGFEREL